MPSNPTAQSDAFRLALSAPPLSAPGRERCGKQMVLNDIERKRIEKIVDAHVQKHRPAPHIRPELDIGFRVSGQSVEIFEIRPRWKEPKVKMEHPVAKATYIRSQDLWKIFWMRSDLKWHGYEPLPAVGSIEKFLAVVEKDEHACFWG